MLSARQFSLPGDDPTGSPPKRPRNTSEEVAPDANVQWRTAATPLRSRRTAWLTSAGVTTGVPEQAPPPQRSPVVQALPSSHGVSSGLDGFEQTPVPTLQVPASWHESLAVHTTGLPLVHVPVWHVSVCVHALPSLHAVPFAFAGFEQTPVPALHVPAL